MRPVTLAFPAMAGGVAVALAFPGTDWAGLAWVGLAPLWLATVLSPPRTALAIGWGSGTAFFLVLLRWLDFTISTYSSIPWPLSWLPVVLLAAYCGLWVGAVSVAVAWIAARRGPGLALLVAPWAWVVAEWGRGWLFGGFPWGLLGYSQHAQLPVIQVAEIGGVYAVSFVLVAANSAVAGVVALGWRRALPGALAAVLLIAVTVAFGAWRLARPEPSGGVTVAVIQPSIEQPLKWDPDHAARTLRTYLDLTRQAGGARPSLIVWPETATPTVLGRDVALQAALRDLSRRLGAALVVGSIDLPERSRPTNSAFLLTGEGVVGRYDKIQLVPFGEYVPLASVIGFVRGWADFISELEPGSRPVVFPGPPAPFGVVICYEGVFPELVRRFVKGGARLMVNMTNDGWFGRTSGPLQHLAMYPLRAVEHRTALVRSANTGVSAVIAPTGAVTATLPLYARGTLAAVVPLRTGQTLYTRLGDWLVWTALAVTGLALVTAAVARIS